MSEPVDFWFDPICPWTWATARWLDQAARVRPIAPRWHLMSLAVLNAERWSGTAEGRDRALVSRQAGRVMAAAQKAGGQAALRRVYFSFGPRAFDAGRRIAGPGELDVLAESLAEAGLPPGLIDAADSTEFDAAVEASHAAGTALVGPDVGSPIVAALGAAFFGPVVSPAPRGEAAGRLWDAWAALAAVPGVYELKRSRP
ncbi:MAG: disulfide bond formation protein DsbA, partial [Bifidobacteriaceae bacterium]|nr:disulfide bond formation protein DsbA [Bifidobacteriaceae bacterium]